MLLSIAKCYSTLLLSVSAASLSIFITGFYFIFRKPSVKKISAPSSTPTLDEDFSAFSGEDVIATQLDLARAYLETDKKSLAKTILTSVMQHGNAEQQLEAKQLIQQT